MGTLKGLKLFWRQARDLLSPAAGWWAADCKDWSCDSAYKHDRSREVLWSECYKKQEKNLPAQEALRQNTLRTRREAERRHQLIPHLSSTAPAALQGKAALLLLLPLSFSASRQRRAKRAQVCRDISQQKRRNLSRRICSKPPRPRAKSNLITSRKLPPKQSAAQFGARVVRKD